MKKLMKYYNEKSDKIIILESIEDGKILFINMEENIIIKTINYFENVFYETLNFINETINPIEDFEIDNEIKNAFIEYIEEEEIENENGFEIISVLLK